MKKVTLYHNPRCSKSREALALLKANKIEPELRLYLEQPLNKPELKQLLGFLDLSARDLLRTGEDAYKTLELSDTTLSEAALITAILSEPKLLQRPIAVLGQKAVIARPPEKVLELLS